LWFCRGNEEQIRVDSLLMRLLLRLYTFSPRMQNCPSAPQQSFVETEVYIYHFKDRVGVLSAHDNPCLVQIYLLGKGRNPKEFRIGICTEGGHRRQLSSGEPTLKYGIKIVKNSLVDRFCKGKEKYVIVGWDSVHTCSSIYNVRKPQPSKYPDEAIDGVDKFYVAYVDHVHLLPAVTVNIEGESFIGIMKNGKITVHIPWKTSRNHNRLRVYQRKITSAYNATNSRHGNESGGHFDTALKGTAIILTNGSEMSSGVPVNYQPIDIVERKEHKGLMSIFNQPEAQDYYDGVEIDLSYSTINCREKMEIELELPDPV